MQLRNLNQNIFSIPRSLLTGLTVIFSLVSVYAQDLDLKETFLEAESYFLFEEYNEALPLYSKIHRAMPDNTNITYKMGICFLNDPYNKEKSIYYLEKACKDINPKYKENHWKETSAPEEAYYYLGMAYLVNNDVDKAQENFEYFRSILDEDIYDVELVESKIQICKNARDLMKKPVDFDSRILNEKINSRFAETKPILSGNGKFMVFIRELQFYNAIFFSEKVNGEWQAPRNLTPELQIDVDEEVFPTFLSYDGTLMILYKNDEFIGNLYRSKLVDGVWGQLENLGPNINTKYWESHGILSRDEKTLYFTSNRKGGYGGLDIYKSEKQADGSWGVPKNLGDKINTRYNEETPFLTNNEKILFFSSYGHFNMGGYDVFYSTIDKKGNWGEPINLGYPINTTDDDIFYFPVNNGYNGYQARYKDEGFGRNDIYYLDIYSENNPRMYLITAVLSSDMGEITKEDSMTIYLIDNDLKDTVAFTHPDYESRSFQIKAPKGDYNLLFRSSSFKDLVTRIRIDKNTAKSGIDLTDDLSFDKKEYIPKYLSGEESRIEINDSIDIPASDDSLHIELHAVPGSQLLIYRYVDSVLVGVDTLYVSEADLNYTVAQIEGENTLMIKMIEENGDLSESQVKFFLENTLADQLEDSSSDSTSVNTDMQESNPDIMETDPEKLAIQNKLKGLLAYENDEVAAVMGGKNLAESDIESEEELYNYLEENGVSEESINELKLISLSDNDAEKLLQMLFEASDGPLKKYLGELDLEKEDITSAADLLRHLKEASQAELEQSLVEILDVLAAEEIDGVLSANKTLSETKKEDQLSSKGDQAKRQYKKTREDRKGGRILGTIILFTGAFVFIFFFIRRRRRKDEEED